MKHVKLMDRLTQYMDAGFPILYLNTFEEKLAMELLQKAAHNAGRVRLIQWDMTQGYSEYSLRKKEYLIPPMNCEFTELTGRMEMKEFNSSLFVIKDISSLLDNPAAVAFLKELSIRISIDIESNIVLLSSVVKIPKELENFVTIVEMDYQTEEEIQETIQRFCEEQETTISRQLLNEMAVNFKGLTESEIISILSLALSNDGDLSRKDMSLIFEQKQQKIRKSGILEMIPLKENLEDIGGLEVLKNWLKKKAVVMKDLGKAEKFGVDAPKGVLIAGVPGCGKSLSAKAAADLFQVPLLRMDMGRLMGKYVGESEENLRKAIALAEAISPCVLWVDELEKAFAGIGGIGGGAEVTTRLFGNFLTWMQEKEAPVFVVATANDITKLPPELLRKGRFDEIYYVGLPKDEERRHIFEIHIKKRRPNDLKLIDLSRLVKETNGYSGADIESVVKDSIETAFVNQKSAVTTEDILASIKQTHSLSEIMKEPIEQMKKIYEQNKFKNASK
ncbi:MAG: AAA family ATPase [Lachnospiraceae bacterium]|nr:AAA family ATPase [Lachnospiraceae bacterium]